jgi:hypothetical protein
MNSKKALEYQFESDSDRKVTLRDLCPQDKAKIGQLIKKLAHEKQEKENLLTMYQSSNHQASIRPSKTMRKGFSSRLAANLPWSILRKSPRRSK